MTTFSTNTPTAIGAISILVWGISALWIRISATSLGGLRAIIAIQSGVAIVSMAIWLSLGKGHVMRQAITSRWFWVRLALFCSNVCFYFIAMALVSHERVPLVILINYLWPTLALFSFVLIAGTPVTRRIWFFVGCAIVVASISTELVYDRLSVTQVLTESRSQDVVAYVFVFLGALSWALYSGVTRRWGDSSGGATVGPLFSLSVVVVATLLLFVVPQPEPQVNANVIGWVLVAIVGNTTAFWCWDYGIRRGSAVVLSLLADGMPWISLASAHLVLDVPLNRTTIYTTISLVVGAVVCRYGTLAKRISANS